MDEEKTQKDSMSITEVEEHSLGRMDSLQMSEFCDQYHIYFQDFTSLFLQNWFNSQELRLKFSSNGIFYHPERFVQPTCLIFTSETHKKVQNAFVKFGFFEIALQLLCEDDINIGKCQDASGSFGSVFDMQIFQRVIAVKSIQFTDDKRVSVISSTIKEYCCLKIASVLGYAPILQNYFGFDLIIFKNCIQFGMQKTQLIKQFGQKEEQQLRQALYVFHMLHIIHFDIKPANIAFSHQQNRVVFLDFGLSETVRQIQGLKTLAGYRGSISFCSEEMLNIFYDYTQKHYIDVYYNDVTCLKNTIKVIKEHLGKEKKYILNEGQTVSIDKYPKIYEISRYIISLAKYLICNMRFMDFKELAKASLAPFMRSIFSFLKQMNSNPYIDSFFIQYFKEDSHIQDYRELKYKFAKKSRLWSNHLHYNLNQIQQQNQSTIFQNQIIEISINSDILKRYETVQQMESMLQYPQTLHSWDAQIYYQIYFKLVRFDTNVYNLASQTKSRLAFAFSKHILKQIPLNSHGLDIIRKNYEFLMRYALSQPVNLWKRNNLYLILRQFIILDCNFQDLYIQFKQKIDSYYQSTEQSIMHIIQIQKTQKLLLLKYRSSFPNSLKLLHQYFHSLYETTFRKIVQSNTFQGELIKIIIRKLTERSSLKQNYKQMVSLYQQDLAKFSNKTLQRQFQKFIQFNQLYIRISDGDVNTCFSYLQHMNPYFSTNIFMNNRKNIVFDLGLYQLIILMKVINNTSELQHIASLMKDSFSFQEIYVNFKIQLLIFLSQNSDSKQGYLHYANQLIKCPLEITHQLISAEFISIWTHIGMSPSNYMHQTYLIEELLDKINVFLCKSQMPSELTFQNIVNQSFIFQLAAQFKQNKHKFVQKALQTLKDLYESQENKTTVIYLRMKYLIYSGSLNMSLQNVQGCYQSFTELLKIGFQMRNLRLINFCYINLFLAAHNLGRDEEQKFYLRVYGNICNRMQQFKGYFTQSAADLIFLTLKTLAYYKQQRNIFTLLVDLSTFITLYPLKDYFYFWIESVNRFKNSYSQYFTIQSLQRNISQRLNWQNIYLICYFSISLQSYDSQTKFKVLRRISVGLRGLKPFARDFVMNIYYPVTFQLIKENKAKARFILQRESKHYNLKDLGKGIRKGMRQKIIKCCHHHQVIKFLKLHCKKIKLF